MSIVDAINLPESIINDLDLLCPGVALEIRHWRTFTRSIFNDFIIKKAHVFHSYIRKLSIVKDPGGKSRIIAILDYWSQAVMKNIHTEVFKILEQLPQDRTFTQDPHVDFEGPYYSFDLSAATDRFPIALQERVVRSLFNSQSKAEAWSRVMVDQEFYVPWESTTVKYRVGQPMGAYSSWAIFALSHHIIVQYSAFLVGEYPTKNYILLGDDIVIGGQELADSYKDVVGSLGVGISEHKTHMSNNTYEFAKRWFVDGVEYSGIQVKAFMETWRNYPLLFQTLKSYYERGLYPYRSTSYPELVSTLLELCGMFPAKARNIARKVDTLNGFYRWIHEGDLATIRSVLVNHTSDEASLPNESHIMFNYLMKIRLDMSLTVIHASLVKKVQAFLDNVYDYLKPVNPSPAGTELVEEEIDWDRVAVDDEYAMKVMNMDPKMDSEHLSYSDIHNLPVTLSLQAIHQKLFDDERISIGNDNLNDHISALVIPSLEEIKSTKRGSEVLIKTNVVAQKVLMYHKNLARGQWMFELQGFNKLGLNPNSLPNGYFSQLDT
jgi:hypothetical protein